MASGTCKNLVRRSFFQNRFWRQGGGLHFCFSIQNGQQPGQHRLNRFALHIQVGDGTNRIGNIIGDLHGSHQDTHRNIAGYNKVDGKN